MLERAVFLVSNKGFPEQYFWPLITALQSELFNIHLNGGFSGHCVSPILGVVLWSDKSDIEDDKFLFYFFLVH